MSQEAREGVRTCIGAEVKVHPLLLASRAVVRGSASCKGAARQALAICAGHKDAGVPRSACACAVLLQEGCQDFRQRLQRLHVPDRRTIWSAAATQGVPWCELFVGDH